MKNETIFVDITASIKVGVQGKVVEFGIKPSYEGMIFRQKLLSTEDMPEEFCELTGFRRRDKQDTRASITEAMRIGSTVVPLLFSMALGRPLLAICGRKHVLWLEKVLGEKYDFQILRGSLSGDNVYDELTLDDLPVQDEQVVGGQDDLHIVMISEK